MLTISETVEQTKLAFDFIERLYLEVSYLIKEIEGILYEENERFVIGKPSGYGISTRSSTGLESNNVKLWLLKKFAVFFVPEDRIEIKGGQTITRINDDLKVLYLRFSINDVDTNEPVIFSGVFYNIQKKPQAKWIKKFENVMGHIEYRDKKIFKNVPQINYEDAQIKLQGELIKNSLFEINDSETILEKVIQPSLELFAKH